MELTGKITPQDAGEYLPLFGKAASNSLLNFSAVSFVSLLRITKFNSGEFKSRRFFSDHPDRPD